MGAIPLSAVLGSLLAGWILGRGWLGLPGWRWLFIVEGAPAILLGVAAFFLLTDWPREAAWLNAEQRKWLEQKLKEETTPCTAAITVWQAMRSPPIVWMAALTVLAYIGQYTFVFWFPTMLKRLTGFTDMRIGIVGALPCLAAFVAMQIDGWHSHKQGERRWHAAMPPFIAGIVYFFLPVPRHSVMFTIGWFTVAGALTAYISTFWAIPTESLSQAEAAPPWG